MTNFLAQTMEYKISEMSYVYGATSIKRFMATHQPTVWMGDNAYVSIMPQIGALKLLPNDRASPFYIKMSSSSLVFEMGNKPNFTVFEDQ
jgi:hypothetical protein